MCENVKKNVFILRFGTHIYESKSYICISINQAPRVYKILFFSRFTT